MALIDVNGHGAIEARLVLPRTGAWQLDLVVDSFDEITGSVTTTIGDGRLELKGTRWRGAEYADSAFVRVVAGADGLRKIARAKHYTQTNARIVIGDLMSTAGEALSATADATTLGRRLDAWTTAAIPVGNALREALAVAAPGSNWRALPDGTIWVGPETWPDSGLTPDDYQIENEDPRQLTASIGFEAPILLPGTTLAGRRISRVETIVNADGVHSTVWFEEDVASSPTRDRLAEAFAAAVGSSIPQLLRFACHRARVVAQKGSTVDVEILNPTIAKFLPSMSRVPLTMPIAGASLQMLATGTVMVGWSGGDPSKPYAFAPDADTVLSKLTVNAPDLRLGDEAAQPFPNNVYRSADVTKNQAMAAAFSALAAASTGPLAPLAGQFTVLAGAMTTFETAAPTYLTTKTKAT